ncbi:MAG TPA: helix-turn-helix transcriptional regulator [Streptosporangiaceae bacterium]|nr:helix-turn-helix transcriptional regulator [Streptosporangiaceae bacterium]
MRTAFRLALGLTQEEVAAEYNRRWPSQSPKTGKYISYWERWAGPGSAATSSAREPSYTDISRLAELYGCLIDDLVTPPGGGERNAAFIGEDDDYSGASGADAPNAPAWADDEEADPTKRRQALKAGVLGATAPWLTTLTPAVAGATSRPGRISTEVVKVVSATAAAAQQLDDQQGGGARGYVADQFAAVTRMLRRDSYDAETGRRLAALAAQLGQTAGFMAYDAHRDLEARRLYVAALQAARAAADRPLAASILSLMSNQAAAGGHINDALRLAAAARRSATNAPFTIRALIAARSGLAYAAARDLSAFRRTHDEINRLIEYAQERPEPIPQWAYYVTRTELNAITGRGMVMLAQHRDKHQRKLLADAEDLLRARALSNETAFGRSALRHGAWLALAYTRSGDLDQAVATGHQALTHLTSVNSARSLRLLHRLRTELAVHEKKTAAVRELTATLDTYLMAHH